VNPFELRDVRQPCFTLARDDDSVGVAHPLRLAGGSRPPSGTAAFRNATKPFSGRANSFPVL
jgi:hypothetical protein